MFQIGDIVTRITDAQKLNLYTDYKKMHPKTDYGKILKIEECWGEYVKFENIENPNYFYSCCFKKVD